MNASLLAAVERGLLVCPHCGDALHADTRCLRCPQAHSFDVARQGYVNLFAGRRTAEAGYDRPLWDARAAVARCGFFDLLVDHCLRELAEFPHLTLLDAGCGEGSFLGALASRLRAGREVQAVGMDLSVQGVRLAAARDKAQAWCVADLAAIPSAPGRFTALFNVLSPANYGEFKRVLAPGGVLVKAVPTPRHLQELRRVMGSRESATSTAVAEHFLAAFPDATRTTVEAGLPCSPEDAPSWLAMTPLGWHATEDQKRAWAAAAAGRVTVSLEVLVARIR